MIDLLRIAVGLLILYMLYQFVRLFIDGKDSGWF